MTLCTNENNKKKLNKVTSNKKKYEDSSHVNFTMSDTDPTANGFVNEFKTETKKINNGEIHNCKYRKYNKK